MLNIRFQECGLFYFLWLYDTEIFLRYLNSFLTGYIRADKYIDYGFLSIEGLLIRLICFISSLLIFQIKSSKPIIASTLTWTMCFFLLSNEHEINTFFPMLIICMIGYSSCIYLFLKQKVK